MNDGLKDTQRNAILEVLNKHPKIERAVLFGSRAMGSFTRTSDIDIALYGDLSLRDQARIADELAQLSIPYTVDLVRMKTVKSKELLEHIKRHGSPWLTTASPSVVRSAKEEAGSVVVGDPTTGDIPDHWEFTTLGEVCRRGGGNIQTGPFGSQLHASDYVPVGVPSIMPTNIGENRIVENGIVRITEHDANRLGQHRLKIGDIIYSRRGDVEKRALIRKREEGWFCGTGCLKVRLGSGVVDPLFASLYLGHPCVREWIVRHAVGATMANLNTSIMANVPFALPPLTEQKAIASVLGSLDDMIELNRQTNDTLEEMARALFKSWFVDFDPVRAKLEGRPPAGMDAATAALFPDHFQDSELVQVPKGWEVGRLDQIATILMGLSPNGDSYNADGIGIPLINGPVEFGDYFPVKTKWTEEATRFCCENDLIFCVRGSTTGRRVVADGEYGIGRGVCAMRAKDEFHIFLYQTINVGLDRLLEKTTGSVFPSLSAPDIKGFSVLMPSKGVLEAFNRIANPLILSIKENQNESRDLAALRDTLLPKLLR